MKDKDVNFLPGDIVKVYQKIKEGEKTRIQIFQGVVIKIKGRKENKTFTVRKVVGSVAVERIYPLMSPNIQKIEIKAHSKKKIRRSKLYYLKENK